MWSARARARRSSRRCAWRCSAPSPGSIVAVAAGAVVDPVRRAEPRRARRRARRSRNVIRALPGHPAGRCCSSRPSASARCRACSPCSSSRSPSSPSSPPTRSTASTSGRSRRPTAGGAGTRQMLRTAVVPQILPAYASYVAVRLRAQPAGVGRDRPRRRRRHRPAARVLPSQFDWEAVWGIVVMFIIVVFVVDRVSTLAAAAAGVTAAVATPHRARARHVRADRRPAVAPVAWRCRASSSCRSSCGRSSGSTSSGAGCSTAPGDLYTVFRADVRRTSTWSTTSARRLRAMWDSIAMAWLGTLLAAVRRRAAGVPGRREPRAAVVLVRHAPDVQRAASGPRADARDGADPGVRADQDAPACWRSRSARSARSASCARRSSRGSTRADRGGRRRRRDVGCSGCAGRSMPQAMPEIASFVLYRFEINIRVSAVLGVARRRRHRRRRCTDGFCFKRVGPRRAGADRRRRRTIAGRH